MEDNFRTNKVAQEIEKKVGDMGQAIADFASSVKWPIIKRLAAKSYLVFLVCLFALIVTVRFAFSIKF